MGDLESLLLVLAAIYLGECAVWVPRGSVVFTRWIRGQFQLRHVGLLTGNQRGGLWLAHPLPPLGTVFLNLPFPFSVSEQGILGFTSASLDPAGKPVQSGRYFELADVRMVTAQGKAVLVNGEQFLKVRSPVLAAYWASWMDTLRQLPEKKRAPEIRARLRQSLDIPAIEARLSQFRPQARRLRLLGNVLFGYLFVIAPIVVFKYGLGHLGWILLALLLAQTITVALLFRRAHKSLYPSAGEERFKAFLTMLLAPPTAIRSADHLGRTLLERAHPLAVACRLCTKKTFKDYARRFLLDLRFPALPICPVPGEAAARCEADFRRTMTDCLEEFLRGQGLDPAQLIVPPQRSEPDNRTYCPRCHEQFVSAAGICQECGGRPLVEL